MTLYIEGWGKGVRGTYGSCCNGETFSTKQAAKSALRTRRAYRDVGLPRPVAFYKCPLCRAYHLTKEGSLDQRVRDARVVSQARRAAGCVKVAYATEDAALRSLIAIVDGPARERYPRCAYQCRWCGTFHLSSWVPQTGLDHEQSQA